MWAGYKGWPACVDLLLKWGASVNSTDDNGYTPLHWALVKGSKACLDKLVEYGADRFAKTNEGKTPNICAEEMNTKRAYHRALADHGYDTSGNIKTLPLKLHTLVRDRSKMSKLFFLYPFLIIFIGLYIISHLTIYIGIPVLPRSLSRHAIPRAKNLHDRTSRISPDPQNPLSGRHLRRHTLLGRNQFLTSILPFTFSVSPFTSIAFAALFSSTAYFYFLSMLEDPGWIPSSPRETNNAP